MGEDIALASYIYYFVSFILIFLIIQLVNNGHLEVAVYDDIAVARQRVAPAAEG